MSKLPNDIRLLVSRLMTTNSDVRVLETEWKIDEVIKLLKKEIESREMCNFVSKNNGESPQNKRNSTQYNSSKNRQEFTASALVTNTGTDISCVYCRKSHMSSRCDNITDINARKSILR